VLEDADLRFSLVIDSMRPRCSRIETTLLEAVEEARQKRDGRLRRGKWKVLEGCRSVGREGRKLLEAAMAANAAAADAIEVEEALSL